MRPVRSSRRAGGGVPDGAVTNGTTGIIPVGGAGSAAPVRTSRRRGSGVPSAVGLINSTFNRASGGQERLDSTGPGNLHGTVPTAILCLERAESGEAMSAEHLNAASFTPTAIAHGF